MRTLAAIAALVCLSLPAGAFAELRTYEVDARYRQEVYRALHGILQGSPKPTGQIERLPTGQLLIQAAPEVHQQIEAVLSAVAARQPAAAPQVTVRYWAVLGTPGADDGAGVPAILHEVLDEIESVYGALGFRVLGNAMLVTESGQWGELEGYPLSVEQQTYAQGTELNAQLGIEFTYTRCINPNSGRSPTPCSGERLKQDIDLRTTLEAGDMVVLAENTIDSGQLEGTMFYIVHWPGQQ